MSWKPTPKNDLLAIRRYDRDTGEWRRVQYRHLKAGDIYAAFGRDGNQVNPASGEPIEPNSMTARVLEDAHRNPESGQGYRALVALGSLEEHLKILSQ